MTMTTITITELAKRIVEGATGDIIVDMSPIVAKWSPEDEMLAMSAESELGLLDSLTFEVSETGEKVAVLAVDDYPAYGLPMTEEVSVDFTFYNVESFEFEDN